MFDPGSGNCKAKVGLLVLRECGRGAVGACAVCGIPVCNRHQVPVPQGAVCPDCAARNQQLQPVGQVGRSRRRMTYYHHYGYTPYYFHRDHYYTDRDHETVSRREAGQEPDQAVMSREALDDYDAFES